MTTPLFFFQDHFSKQFSCGLTFGGGGTSVLCNGDGSRVFEQVTQPCIFVILNGLLLDKGSLLPCQIFIQATQRPDTMQMVITFYHTKFIFSLSLAAKFLPHSTSWTQKFYFLNASHRRADDVKYFGNTKKESRARPLPHSTEMTTGLFTS